MGIQRVPRMPLLLRASVSISILVTVLSQTSLEALVARARSGALAPLALALLLVLLMALLVTFRWRLLAAWMGIALPAALAVRAVFLGLFGGQLLPSTVGSDLVRGWVAARHSGSIRRAAASVIADRLVALFAACLLLALTYASPGQIRTPVAGLLVPVALLASGALLLAFLLACTGALRRVFTMNGRILRGFESLEGVLLQPKPIVGAILVALAIHSIAVIAAAVTAAAYGVEASVAVWLVIVPVSLIACAVPVSINGWGVREAVMVALAAGQGIPQADALVVSLTLGGLNVLASLPGAWLLLARRGAP